MSESQSNSEILGDCRNATLTGSWIDMSLQYTPCNRTKSLVDIVGLRCICEIRVQIREISLYCIDNGGVGLGTPDKEPVNLED